MHNTHDIDLGSDIEGFLSAIESAWDAPRQPDATDKPYDLIPPGEIWDAVI